MKRHGLFLMWVGWFCVLAGARAATLESVKIDQTRSSTVLFFELSESVPYRIFTLINPHRLVIDFDQTRLAMNPQKIAIHSPEISRVQSGQPRPGTLRLVFQLKKKMVVQPSLTHSRRKFRVSLFSAVTPNMALKTSSEKHRPRLMSLKTHTDFSSKKPVFLRSTAHITSQSRHSFMSWLKNGHVLLQLGGYWSLAGSEQHINIDDLIGDEFTVTENGKSNGLIGLGYLIDGPEDEYLKLSYGINAFYLPKTVVSGTVTQENLFTNLAYDYRLTQYPIYATVKSVFKTKWPQYSAALDIGVGPNFMQVHGFNESPLDDNTLPDSLFSSHTTGTFTATAGANLRINHFFGPAPLECGYRFFYLGKGHFNIISSQVLNTLNTGNVYGNAVTCAITV